MRLRAALAALPDTAAPESEPAPKRAHLPLVLPNEGMKLSEVGEKLIKEFESCLKRRPDGSIEAYLCPAGVWTIGWGCTKGVKPGMVISQQKADDMFRSEISYFEVRVAQLVTVPLTQYEFDALVSFAYNCGDGALAKSTLLKLLNKGNKSAVPNQLLRWNKGGGRVLKGLVRRRKAEGALFLANAAKLRGEAADYGPMPQAVEAAKGSRVEVVKSSRTFWTALLGLFGSIAAKFVDASAFVGSASSDAEGTVAGLQSFFGLLGLSTEVLGAGIGAAALIAVILIRLNAAAEEKIG